MPWVPQAIYFWKFGAPFLWNISIPKYDIITKEFSQNIGAMSAPSHFFESLGPPSFETFRFPNIADVFDRLSSFPVLPPPKMALSRIIYIYIIYIIIYHIYIYVHMLYDLSWYTGSTHPVGIQSTSTQSNTTSSRSQLRRAPSNLAMRPAAGVPSGPGICKGFQEKCHMWSY